MLWETSCSIFLWCISYLCFVSMKGGKEHQSRRTTMRLPQKCSFSLSPNFYSFIVVYIRRLLPKAQWTRPLIFHTAPHTLIEGQDCSTGNRKKTPKRILLDKKNFFVCLLCHGGQHRCDDCCIRGRKCFASKLYFQKGRIYH